MGRNKCRQIKEMLMHYTELVLENCPLVIWRGLSKDFMNEIRHSATLSSAKSEGFTTDIPETQKSMQVSGNCRFQDFHLNDCNLPKMNTFQMDKLGPCTTLVWNPFHREGIVNEILGITQYIAQCNGNFHYQNLMEIWYLQSNRR